MEALLFALSFIWAGVSQFPRMLRAVHWHQKWGIVVSWLWKRLSVHWAWGSSFKHELPGNLRVSGCLNRTARKVIIGGFKLDKGRLSCCPCPLMLFRTHDETKKELEETWQSEEDVVVEGTGKLLPWCGVTVYQNPTEGLFPVLSHSIYTKNIKQAFMLCFKTTMSNSHCAVWQKAVHENVVPCGVAVQGQSLQVLSDCFPRCVQL